MDDPKPRVVTKSDPRRLVIEWNDGVTTAIGAAELRGACRCAHCVDEVSGKQRYDRESTPTALETAHVELVGHYALGIRFSDGHATGIYTWSVLRTLGDAAPLMASEETLGSALEFLAASPSDPERVARALEALGRLVLEGSLVGIEQGAGLLHGLLSELPPGSLAGADFEPWLRDRIRAARTAQVLGCEGARPDAAAVAELLEDRDRLAALEAGAELFEVALEDSVEDSAALEAADARLAAWADLA